MKKNTFVLKRQAVPEIDGPGRNGHIWILVMQGILMFIWITGCMRWFCELLELEVIMGPVIAAAAVICLLFEITLRFHILGRACGIVFIVILADVWLNWQKLQQGFGMIAGQAAEIISDYFQIALKTSPITAESHTLIHILILLAALLIFTAGLIMVKWSLGTLTGLTALFFLTVSLMLDQFPSAGTALLMLIGTAGLIAQTLSGVWAEYRGQKDIWNGWMHLRWELFVVGIMLILGMVSYLTADRYLADRMHSYYDYVREYPQQMLAKIQTWMTTEDKGETWLQQLMGSFSDDFGTESGQLSHLASVQTGAVVLSADVTAEPSEPVYFKSYIGDIYDLSAECWEQLDDNKFKAAVSLWPSAETKSCQQIQDDLAACLYESLEAMGIAEPCSYQIMNEGAGKTYTWAPYGVDITGLSVQADGLLMGSQKTDFQGYLMPDAEYFLQLSDYYSADTDRQMTIDDYSNYVFEHYLDIPEGMDALWEGYEQLTEELDEASTERWIKAIQNHLSEKCTYDRDGFSNPLEGNNLINYFYGTAGKGYCTHFASAGVILLRMAGIPARYVTGYVAWPGDFEYDSQSGLFHADITGYGGHAWAEVYDRATGAWIPVEMTPGSGVQSAVTETENSIVSAVETENTDERATETHENAVEHPESEIIEKNESESSSEIGENETVIKETVKAEKTFQPLIGAAIILLMGLLCLGYRRRKSNSIQRFSKVNRNKALLSMEWHLTEMMEKTGWKTEKSMDDWAYARWLQEKVETLEEDESLFFMEKLHQAAYSDDMISEEDYQKCLDIYQKILHCVVGGMKGIKKFWYQ